MTNAPIYVKMISKGLTLKSLSETSGVATATLRGWFRAARTPGAVPMSKVATVLCEAQTDREALIAEQVRWMAERSVNP